MRATICLSEMGRISASARRWHGCKRVSCWKKSRLDFRVCAMQKERNFVSRRMSRFVDRCRCLLSGMHRTAPAQSKLMGGEMIRSLAIAALMTASVMLSAQAEPGKIKIGYVNTFSGPNAFIGNDEKDGFELALDHLGRKMGGLDVQMIYEDDQIKPEVGRQVTEKLLQSDKVDVVTGYNWSNVLLASVKPAVDAKTFIISGNAGPSQLAGEACSPWFFSASWQNDQTPMALGDRKST